MEVDPEAAAASPAMEVTAAAAVRRLRSRYNDWLYLQDEYLNSREFEVPFPWWILLDRKLPNQPEHTLISRFVIWLFFRRCSAGFGTLALFWATVVLVSGFRDALSIKDFIFVLVIAVIAAAGLFCLGDNQNLAYLLNLGDAMLLIIHDWERKVFLATKGCTRAGITLLCLIPLHLLLSFVFVFVELAINELHITPLACIALPLVQLVSQNYGPKAQDTGHVIMLQTALNVFYSIAFVQGALSFVGAISIRHNYTLASFVSDEYGFEMQWGHEAMRRYRDYLTNNLRSGERYFDMAEYNLVSYVIDALQPSSSRKEMIRGIRILHSFIHRNKHNRKEDAIRKIQQSQVAIESIVQIASSDDPDEVEPKTLADEVLVAIGYENTQPISREDIKKIVEETIECMLSSSRCSINPLQSPIVGGN